MAIDSSMACAAFGVQAETVQDIQQLKQQLAEIQKNYQAQIQLLESRIEQLEARQGQAQPEPAQAVEQSRPTLPGMESEAKAGRPQ